MAGQDGEQLDAGPSPMTSSHASVNFRFSSDQRQILQDYWSKGMTSCSREHSSMVDECSRRADCTMEQVKVCVIELCVCLCVVCLVCVHMCVDRVCVCMCVFVCWLAVA